MVDASFRMLPSDMVDTTYENVRGQKLVSSWGSKVNSIISISFAFSLHRVSSDEHLKVFGYEIDVFVNLSYERGMSSFLKHRFLDTMLVQLGTVGFAPLGSY